MEETNTVTSFNDVTNNITFTNVKTQRGNLFSLVNKPHLTPFAKILHFLSAIFTRGKHK